MAEPASTATPVPGSTVIIPGIQSKPELNGTQGIVLAPRGDRWVVELASGTTIALKATSFAPLVAEAQAQVRWQPRPVLGQRVPRCPGCDTAYFMPGSCSVCVHVDGKPAASLRGASLGGASDDDDDDDYAGGDDDTEDGDVDDDDDWEDCEDDVDSGRDHAENEEELEDDGGQGDPHHGGSELEPVAGSATHHFVIHVEQPGEGADGVTSTPHLVVHLASSSATGAHAGNPADLQAPPPSDLSHPATAATTTAAEHGTPAVDPRAVRVCAWSGCGRALSADPAEQSKCGRCKTAFYCGRTCQKRHWGRGGHKTVCVEPPSCNICLDGGDEPVPIQRGCACRGDAGLAHVACLAEVAARKEGGYHEGWHTCPTCGQHYTGAMDLGLQLALVHRMRTRPRDDVDRLDAEGHLGSALSDAGKFAEAADVLARVLTAKKRVHGEEGASTLATANMLGNTYYDQGKLAEAEELQVWLLEASGRVHGEEHSVTLAASTNLAITYSKQGKHEEAEELKVRVLEVHRRVRGEEHPRTLAAADNLATTCSRLGKHAEAEELEAGALAVSRRVLGTEHPDTLITANNLADTYRQQGRLAEAEALLVEVLAASRRVRGAAHTDTLRCVNNLALTYDAQGREADGDALWELYHP